MIYAFTSQEDLERFAPREATRHADATRLAAALTSELAALSTRRWARATVAYEIVAARGSKRASTTAR